MLVHVGIAEAEEGDNYKIHVHDQAKVLEQDVPRSGKIKTMDCSIYLSLCFIHINRVQSVKIDG